MRVEFDALIANKPWSLIRLPPGRFAVGCKWVFRIKENPDGTISMYWARLVAKGFHQRLDCDYSETFSPVVQPVTVRVVLTLALSSNWSIKQIDVNNAFFNGILEEDVLLVLKQLRNNFFANLWVETSSPSLL